MNQNGFFEVGSERHGLVIVFPAGITSLFDPRVHALVREVEGELESVFVTYALSGGSTPDVASAVNAARFAGCSTAIVVHSEEWLGRGDLVDPGTDTLAAVWHGAADFTNSAERVVAAYNQARRETGNAA